jgi:SPP1 gp7 family putative phage head morphogenesis protein
VGLHLAILAAAARGHRKRHGNARPRRRLRPIVRNARAELEYKRALLQLVKRVRAIVDKELVHLKPHWPQLTAAGDSRVVADSEPSPEIGRAISRMKGQLGGLDNWAKRMAGLAAMRNHESVDKRLASEIERSIGIDVSGLLLAQGPLLGAMQKATLANVELIKSIPDQYLDRVYETVTGAWSQGLRWESMVEQIQEDGDVTENRAKLIARDQTSKMNAAFSQERMEGVGIERYEWSTSQDERVRESHADMDGKVCDWDDPPDVDGENVHPGEAINCRCVAIPVVDMEEVAEATGASEEELEQEAA